MGVGPYTSQHSAESSWPIALGVDERGRSIYVCADCGDEIPDGVLVERDATGRVVAYTREVVQSPEGESFVDRTGFASDHFPLVEADRQMVHSCEASRG